MTRIVDNADWPTIGRTHFPYEWNSANNFHHQDKTDQVYIIFLLKKKSIDDTWTLFLSSESLRFCQKFSTL